MLAQPDRDFDPGRFGNWAVLITVLVTYISAAVGAGSRYTPQEWLVMILLGLVSLLLAVPISHLFFGENYTWQTAFFFVLQLALCGIINWIGQGQFWLLFLPLASQATGSLSRWAQAVVLVGIFILFLLPFADEGPALMAQWGLVFFCALAFVLLFTEASVRNLQARREVERLAHDLEEANRRLREYAAQAEELARSRERNRLAREIHDSLGHYLTVVNVQIEAAKALMESRGWRGEAPDLYAALDKAQKLTRNGLADVRKSVAALRAGPLDERPFLEAVNLLAEECREAGLVAKVRVAGAPRTLAPAVELAMYRTIQEALTNVRKHARASQVDVTIEYADAAVRLEVLDNGVGLTAGEGEGEKFGLRGIRERVDLLRGTMRIGPGPENGVHLQVELPIP